MQLCREGLNEILLPGATRQFQIHVVPGADHDPLRSATGGELEARASPGRVAGVHALITDWVRTRVGLSSVAKRSV